MATSRNLKAAGALVVAMVVLQGCNFNFDPLVFAFLTVTLSVLDVQLCVLTTMSDAMNTTDAYKVIEGCFEEKNGKVQNVSQCCIALSMADAVATSNSQCCNKEWVDNDLKTFPKRYNMSGPLYANMTANLTSIGWDDTLVDLCENVTKNETQTLKNLSITFCAPGTDTISTDDMEMHLALFDDALVQSIDDKKASVAAELSAEGSDMRMKMAKFLNGKNSENIDALVQSIAEKKASVAAGLSAEGSDMTMKMAEFLNGKNSENISVRPAGLFAAFFVGGVAAAVFAHGLVQHFRAQREVSSNYAQLLA